MPRALIVVVALLTGCAGMVRTRGTYTAGSDVGTIVTAAAVATEWAIRDARPEPLCDGDTDADPPHTCPERVQEPR